MQGQWRPRHERGDFTMVPRLGVTMISAFNLRDIQEPVEANLGILKLYLQQIVGQPFLFFRESYGDELTIHLGDLKERKSPRLKDRARGSYVVTVRGSLWTMVAPEKGMLVLSDPPRELNGVQLKKLSFNELEQTPLISPDANVVWATPFDDLSGGIALGLGFSDHAHFIIRPAPPHPDDVNTEDDELPEIADWEIYTPLGRYLRVGPGQKWAYLPSTSKESNRTTTSTKRKRPSARGRRRK
jgi:hypothetical protein